MKNAVCFPASRNNEFFQQLGDKMSVVSITMGKNIRTRKGNKAFKAVLAEAFGGDTYAYGGSVGLFPKNALSPITDPFKWLVDQNKSMTMDFDARTRRLIMHCNLPKWGKMLSEYRLKESQGKWELKRDWPKILKACRRMLTTYDRDPNTGKWVIDPETKKVRVLKSTFDPANYPTVDELDELCQVKVTVERLGPCTPIVGELGEILLEHTSATAKDQVSDAVSSTVGTMLELVKGFAKCLEKRSTGEKTRICPSSITNILEQAEKLRQIGEVVPLATEIQDVLRKVELLDDPDIKDKKSPVHQIAVNEAAVLANSIAADLEGF